MKTLALLLCGVSLMVACHKPSPPPSGSAPASAEKATPQTLEYGRQIYATHCAACHGDTGDGNGPLASMIAPRPRDLTSGIFKYRTTRGPIPNDHDIMQTIKMGIPGTAMPGWNMLGLTEWKALLAHIKTLSPRLDNEAPGRRVGLPERPKTLDVDAGRQLYKSAGCVSCHGPAGHGDGPAAAALKDTWGNPITPRDLTQGPMRWGNTENDLYRTLLIGIAGTPMPAFEQTLTDKQLWSLVGFLKSMQTLPKDYDPSSPQRHLISVGTISGPIPTDPSAAPWQQRKSVPVFLNQLISSRHSPEWLMVSALQNGTEIGFYLRWVDDRSDIGGEQPDRVSMQFPMAKTIANPVDLPFVGMGDAKQAVQLWQWRPDGQSEWNANGVMAMQQQQSTPQFQATGQYADGQWHVIMTRTFASSDAHDAQLETTSGYLAFGLWDGDQSGEQKNQSFSEWLLYSTE